MIAAPLSSESLVASSTSTTRVTPSGRTPGQDQTARVWVNDIGDRFFDTMSIPILYGRALVPQDRATSLPVAVLNEQFVRTVFSGENPLGKTFGNASQTGHIVEVLGGTAESRLALS